MLPTSARVSLATMRSMLTIQLQTRSCLSTAHNLLVLVLVGLDVSNLHDGTDMQPLLCAGQGFAPRRLFVCTIVERRMRMMESYQVHDTLR